MGAPQARKAASTKKQATKKHSDTFHQGVMYGIRRATNNSHWMVTLRRQGIVHARTFSFWAYGGEQDALLHAQAWRDELVKNHPPAARRHIAQKLRPNNTSGIPGVTCVLGADGKPEGWVAKTVLGSGHVASKYFGVRRYGAQEAKSLAIAERNKQLRQMTGLRQVHPDEEVLRHASPDLLSALAPATIDLHAFARNNNLSGIVGVNLHHDRQGEPQAWAATTRLDGKDVSAVFAIKKYGEEEALTLAILARLDQLQQRAKQSRKSSQGPRPKSRRQ